MLNFIDLSKAEGTVEVPNSLINSLALTGKFVSNLPAPDSYGELKNKLAAFYKMPAESIILGNGSDEIIEIIAKVFAGHTSITVVPTFGRLISAPDRYSANAKLLKLLPESNFIYDENAHYRLIKMCDTNHPSSLWFCSPANPTGSIINPEYIKDLAKRYPRTQIIIDEVFVDFIQKSENISMRFLTLEYTNITVVGSFSKTWGIAGLRIGFAFAHPSICPKLTNNQLMFNLASISVELAQECLDNSFYRVNQFQKMRKNRTILLKYFTELSSVEAVSNSAINLIAVKYISRNTIQTFRQLGVGVKSLDSTPGFQNMNYVRLRIPRSTPELNSLIERIGRTK